MLRQEIPERGCSASILLLTAKFERLMHCARTSEADGHINLHRSNYYTDNRSPLRRRRAELPVIATDQRETFERRPISRQMLVKRATESMIRNLAGEPVAALTIHVLSSSYRITNGGRGNGFGHPIALPSSVSVEAAVSDARTHRVATLGETRVHLSPGRDAPRLSLSPRPDPRDRIHQAPP